MKNIRIYEADIHVTTVCSSCCEYCYIDQHGEARSRNLFKGCPKEGSVGVLMDVISSLRFNAGIKDLVFVGGDPCEHSSLVELLIFSKSLGLNTVVLSNTHTYRSSGNVYCMSDIVSLIDEVDFTLHGWDAESHDSFNHTPGSYDRAMRQIKRYMACRKDDQSVGIVLNMVPNTIEHLREIMEGAIKRLELKPGQDFFTIQRIAPVGKAAMEWDRWKITPEMMVIAFNVFDEIKSKYDIETKVTIDTLPWCIVPKKHRHYLEPLEGGCNWGKPDGVLSVLPDGRLQRCALCANDLGVNILDIHSPEAFTEFMLNNPVLAATRNREHLAERCLKCPLLEKCGGGCIIANTDGISFGDPYKTSTPRQGVDYLLLR
ncbi:MAG: radical SAM protein [Candidatus Saccharibacteria bacterium]|nr:radical SAM protein [Candidatus Saccharibacteria bacterium]